MLSIVWGEITYHLNCLCLKPLIKFQVFPLPLCATVLDRVCRFFPAMVKPWDQVLLTGEDILTDCTLNPEETASPKGLYFKLVKDGVTKTFAPTSYLPGTAQLRIANATPEDAGMYFCFYDPTGGMDGKRASVFSSYVQVGSKYTGISSTGFFFIWYNSNYNDNDSRVGITEPLDMGIIGLLPDTQNCGCTCAGNAGNVFPVTAGKWSRHASRHVRHARAVMHAGIAN